MEFIEFSVSNSPMLIWISSSSESKIDKRFDDLKILYF